jgi:hypothetical protein
MLNSDAEMNILLRNLDHIKRTSVYELYDRANEFTNVHCFKDIMYDDEHPIIIITGRDITVHVYLMNDGTIESVALNGSSFINLIFKQVLSHFCDEHVKRIWEGSKYSETCRLIRFSDMCQHIKELQNNLNDVLKLHFVRKEKVYAYRF